DNMVVADVTTPANLFHLLRRHMKTNYRKPLIVFTPKSLLRHPKVVSTKEEMANGSFQELIEDKTTDAEKVKSVVFCTGKFYYDLLEVRESLKRDDVALVRLEQLFPLPADKMRAVIKKYKNADDIVWAQEEPRNMGAYSFLLMHFEEARSFRICSRKMYSAPAAGSSVRSKRRHQRVIDSVFDKSLTL
ncbi:MAG TPA: 2-oxoglutarate dehydrogenase E1 component, partial [Flavobacteriaceae bacterium]|nr:2-oxoglutarate dehydrogenase E1 component [Flavobacteriaceae bacterium]